MADQGAKVAIVTGGGSGIGAEISRRFVQDGFSVVVADRDAGNAAAIAKALGDRATFRDLDVTDETAVDRVVADTAERHGRLDIIVTSAGIGIQKSLLETSREEFARILDVNVTGMFLCGRAAARVMVRQGAGRIINIASVAGQRGVPGRVAYSASKGGVIAMTQVMAVELGQYGITVNAIAPGPIETALTARMHTDETRKAYNAASPLGRYGTLAELAAAASFLASDEASYVNGQTLAVDGGMGVAGPLFKV